LPKPGRILFSEMAAKAEARIVDQHRHSLACSFDIRHQLGRGSGGTEIHRNGAGIAKFIGQSIQPLFPSRNQNQPMSALRQLPSELDP
jgi:hypothetical protein